ncbi:MAG TPA: SNF2-related protein [Kiritimatiellia bacterium]|nr:SNF2-related protein [Kiritimatiellia bacterium]
MPIFKIGQRWISETEPELGLGKITAVEFGRIQVEYPAANETRLYASDHAPLKRVIYHPGDRISNADGNAFVIESVAHAEDCLTYSGNGHTVHESDLKDAQTYDKPEARLLAGHFDPWPRFDLRKETNERRAWMESHPMRGLLGGRIDLIPHQIYIASEVSRRDVPRVLLADEVGLGKTIEACLIIHRMLVTGKIRRVLILVPDALIHQWFVELLRRFSLSFFIVDKSRGVAESDDHNPFMDEQNVICGINHLLKNPEYAEHTLSAEWDLLVVDEAHHLAWKPDDPSPAYQLVEAIARKTPGLILLTATPEQLGPDNHFARLRLLDPQRYQDLEKFTEEHKRYEQVVKKTNALLERGDETSLQDLLDRHGPGRVMFRNTRSNMKGFPRRILHLWPLQKSQDDAQATWLAGFLRKNPETKLLAITQTRQETMALQKSLQTMINVNTALFHEEMPIIQCDRQAAWFAEKDGARLMIASEIGGEGRNFQFAQHLALIHIPDDPEMLEQRIGRLDRIGQIGDIHIHVPFIKGTPEADRIRWYHEGLNAFEEPLSGSHDIMMAFRDRLNNIDDELIKQTRDFRLAVKKHIENGRDRLLELNSCRPAVATGLIKQIESADQSDELEIFLARLFDHFGVIPEQLQNRDYLLQRGHLFDQAFPLKEEQLHVTFERRQAMIREDIVFMSWDHPLVRGAIDLMLGSEAGNASLAISSGVNDFALEAVFVLECVAPPELELTRFLPPTPIHVAIGQGKARPGNLRDPKAWELIELQPGIRAALPGLIEKARHSAEKQVPAILKKSADELQAVVGRECKRMIDLKKINDHIRDEEVDAIKDRLMGLHNSLKEAKLRLDSILLIAGELAVKKRR